MIGAMTDGGAASSAQQWLEHAAQVREEARGLRTRVDTARSHAREAAARVDAARERLDEDTRDVARLQSLSWTRVLSGLRGDRSTDLERETAERDAARYELGAAETRLVVARDETAALESQLAALGDPDASFADALAEQEQWATAHDPATAGRLADLARRRGVLAAEDTEGREAYAAGARAHQLLQGAEELLSAAESWSTWDTFGGGGLLTDMVKYDKLDRVADVLRQADLALGAYTRELADLRLAGVGTVGVDGLTRTFDVFFDNLFTDWAVRSRIQETRRRVVAALDAVALTQRRLSDRGRAIADERAALDRERETVLRG
jgi:hypothetical protein